MRANSRPTNPSPTVAASSGRDSGYPWHDSAYRHSGLQQHDRLSDTHRNVRRQQAPAQLPLSSTSSGRFPICGVSAPTSCSRFRSTKRKTDPSLGYDGSDYFSPDFPYVVTDPAVLTHHLATINGLLQAKGFAPIALQISPWARSTQGSGRPVSCVWHRGRCSTSSTTTPADSASTASPTTCHVLLGSLPQRRQQQYSLYFTDQDLAPADSPSRCGTTTFGSFFINNALYYISEFHVDGFRYDEISDLLSMNCDSGWSFCCDLTNTLRFVKPRLLQNAEFWPCEFGNYPKSASPSSLRSPTAARDSTSCSTMVCAAPCAAL